MLTYDLNEFARRVRELNACDRLDDALNAIIDFVIEVISHDSATGLVFSSALLDELCLELGRLGVKPKRTSRRGVVILATAVMPTGGHTRQILDFAEADPAHEVTLLLTNTRHALTTSDVVAIAETGIRVEIAPTGNEATRLRWLQRRMAELGPERTYVFQHHFDSVCVATLQPELTGELIFCHNADYALSLGVQVAHATHIDFHPKGFWNCRNVEGVRRNRFWPLTAEVPPPAPRQWMLDGALRTCCCGGFEKFELPHLLEALPYSITYPDMVATILRATNGVHYHIGNLSADLSAAIFERLQSAGIAETRFVAIPFVPLLWRALQDLEIDVYMGSMPRGGGRATLEAMAAGLPLVIHHNYRSICLSDKNELYEGALTWRTLDELAAQLAGITPATLREHTQLSRQWFERHHAPEQLHACIERLLEGEPEPVPARPEFRPDSLQVFLDLRRAVRTIA